MAYRKNLASYVSDAELREGDCALYYGEKPGTPANKTPFYASFTVWTNGVCDMRFYEFGELKAHFPVRTIKQARQMAKAFARVRGDGVRYCFGVEGDGCKAKAVLKTPAERERSFCDSCEAELLDFYDAMEDAE